MEIVLLSISLIQNFALSLGVGCSTIAVLNYIVASADGVVEQSEQRLMRIVYIALRVAMVAVLVTTLFQSAYALITVGPGFIGPFIVFLYSLIVILLINAFLMTRQLMPRAIGPSLQAASWYALAIINFFYYVGFTNFSFTQLVAGYLILLAITMIAVNGTLAFYRVRV